MRQHHQMASLALAAMALALAACQPDQTVAPPAALSAHRSEGSSHRGLAAQLAALRRLTAPFHSIAAASRAGWDTRFTDCFSSPEGGMGFHYAKTSLIDGVVSATEPELLLYEPRRNGKLKLVAVEYIVFFKDWSGTEPPTLYGQSFHRNEVFQLYGLHVWIWRHNPSGVFADWNPRVSCRYADRVK